MMKRLQHTIQGKLHWLTATGITLLWITALGLFAWLVGNLIVRFSPSNEVYALIVRPTAFSYFLAALPLGLVSVIFLLDPILNHIFASDDRHPFLGKTSLAALIRARIYKASTFLRVPALLFYVGCTLLFAHKFSFIKDETLFSRNESMFGTSIREYKLSEMKGVELVKSKDALPYLKIDFKNGTWTSANIDSTESGKLLNYLSVHGYVVWENGTAR